MVGDLLDVVTILENLRVRDSRFRKYLQRGLLPSTELLNFHIMQPIAFSLELRDRNVQFLSTHTDMKLCTEPHINRSEEHTSELQSRRDLVCRLLLEKKKTLHSRVVRPSCAYT